MVETTKPILLIADDQELRNHLAVVRAVLPRGLPVDHFKHSEDIFTTYHRYRDAADALEYVVLFDPSERLRGFVAALRTLQMERSPVVVGKRHD